MDVPELKFSFSRTGPSVPFQAQVGVKVEFGESDFIGHICQSFTICFDPYNYSDAGLVAVYKWCVEQFGEGAIENIPLKDTPFRYRYIDHRDRAWTAVSGSFCFRDETQAAIFRLRWT